MGRHGDIVGAEVMKVIITSFEESEEEIRRIRDAVFGNEQAVPPEIDWDGRDPDCVHALALEESGEALGTGRLSPEGKIGRLAVPRRERGHGIGAAVIEALLAEAVRKGFPKVHLHAQTQALAFYEKQGFVRRGDPFLEADIEHVYMSKILPDA